MVISSISSPLESSFPSLTFDHTYSKNNLTFDAPASPPSAIETAMSPSDYQIETLVQSDNITNSGDSNNQETDMLCDLDLDDLDFSLSDFAMDAESNIKSSFQDFVDSALRLSSSADVSSASGSAFGRAACLGRQETVALSSSCSSKVVFSDSRSEAAEPMESGQSNSFTAGFSVPTCQSHNTIPTKTCSCTGSESDGTAACVYSSSQSDLTTLSSSTYGKSLKPGDYLPPLFIDTQNYGIRNPSNRLPPFQRVPSATTSLCFPPSERHKSSKESDRQQFDNYPSIPQSSSSAAVEMCSDSSCVLTPPLSLSDLCYEDNERPHQGQEEQRERHTGSYFAETPSDQLDDSIEDLDIESISDLEKYLTEASLDLNILTSHPPKQSLLTVADSVFRPKCDVSSHSEYRTMETKVDDTDSTTVSGLKLSILGESSSKLELTSWLDGYALDAIHTPPSSPELSPKWQESAEYPTAMHRSSKQDANILDLFSDDNAHAFLNDDSAICHMHVSQFL